jgi:hypothetical protein
MKAWEVAYDQQGAYVMVKRGPNRRSRASRRPPAAGCTGPTQRCPRTPRGREDFLPEETGAFGRRFSRTAAVSKNP